MHQNLAVILEQFNYGKNSFIVLIPGHRPWQGDQDCRQPWQRAQDLLHLPQYSLREADHPGHEIHG